MTFGIQYLIYFKVKYCLSNKKKKKYTTYMSTEPKQTSVKI